VNLSASGVLDLNAPSPNLHEFRGGSKFLSSLLSPAPDHPVGVRVSFALLPPVIPELGWLISPLVDSLLADQSAFISLPGLVDNGQTLSFQSVPSLATQPPETVAANPWVATPAKPPQVQLATRQPLAHLTIAESMPGAVNLANVRPSPRRPRNLQPADQRVAQVFKPIQVTEQGLQSLKIWPGRN
jgi:hypothetical protein